jgi:hypothetical protein
MRVEALTWSAYVLNLPSAGVTTNGGQQGTTADGSAATSTSLYGPVAVAVDVSGTVVLLADCGNP